MEDRTRNFWKQHSDLRLQGSFRIPDGTRIYGFMATGGTVWFPLIMTGVAYVHQ